jgi:hypothetical protein
MATTPRHAMQAMSPNIQHRRASASKPGQHLKTISAQRQYYVPSPQVLWTGWLRKLSGAKQSGTRRRSFGGLVKKWDKRWFTLSSVSISGEKRAYIEWAKDSHGSSKGSFCLAGGTVSQVPGKVGQYELRLPPTEVSRTPGKVKEDRCIILKSLEPGQQSEVDEFLKVLATLGVTSDTASALVPAAHSDDGPTPALAPVRAAAAAAAPSTLGCPLQHDRRVHLRFAQAVQAAVRQLSLLHESRQHPQQQQQALDALIAAANSVGVTLHTEQVVLRSGDVAGTLGLRLEPCPASFSASIAPEAAAAAAGTVTMQVKDVVTGSAAELQGIRAGLMLLRINGQSVRGWGVAEIRSSLGTRPLSLTFEASRLGYSGSQQEVSAPESSSSGGGGGLGYSGGGGGGGSVCFMMP